MKSEKQIQFYSTLGWDTYIHIFIIPYTHTHTHTHTPPNLNEVISGEGHVEVLNFSIRIYKHKF